MEVPKGERTIIQVKGTCSPATFLLKKGHSVFMVDFFLPNPFGWLSVKKVLVQAYNVNTRTFLKCQKYNT